MAKLKTTGVRAVARHWDVEHSYVIHMVKKGKELGDPLPLDDMAAADAWRARTAVRGVDTHGHIKGGMPTESETPPDSTPSPKTPGEPVDEIEDEEVAGIGMSGLERALANAKAVERSAYRTLERAKKDPKQGGMVNVLTSAYNKSSERYESMEESVRKERKLRGELISLDDHKIQMNRLVIPQVTLLRKLPRTLAMKVAPGDDGAAETKISESIEELIAEIKKSLTFAEDPDFHFRCWLAAMMDKDSTGAEALKKLADAYTEVNNSLKEPHGG